MNLEHERRDQLSWKFLQQLVYVFDYFDESPAECVMDCVSGPDEGIRRRQDGIQVSATVEHDFT